MENGIIRSRFEVLWTDRKVPEGTWAVIEKFVTPYRGRFFTSSTSGEDSVNWRRREIYDSTAVMAHQNLAASLHGALTSPSIQWFNLRFRNEDLNAEQEAKEWLEESSRIVYDTLQESNFNLEVNETYQDIVGYGTSIMYEEEVNPTKWEGINFTSVPIRDCYFEQDWMGHVYRFYRLISWTAIQIVSKFGKEVPQMIRDKADGTPDEKIDIIFCIFERPGKRAAFEFGGTTKRLAPKARPYGFKYILRTDGTLLGKEGGYYEMPAYVPRWRKTNDSMWGNSPAHMALADIMTLNQLIELVIRAAEKVIDPPTLAEERAILTDLDLMPAGLTMVRKIDGIRPYESGARFDVSQLRIEDLRDAVRSYFFVDQLTLKESPAMTATEVTVRYELMQRLLGPTLGRLQTDFLDPMIQRTFNILMRAKQLPEMPDILQDFDSSMDIDYLGALSRAQKIDQVGNIERWVGMLGGIAQQSGKPDVLDVPDYHAIARGTADMLSVPTKMMKSSKESSKEKETRDTAQAEAASAEIAKLEGEAGVAQGEAEQLGEDDGGGSAASMEEPIIGQGQAV
jgi:hypothetical protein